MTARDTRTIRVPVEVFERIALMAMEQQRSTTQQAIHLLLLALKESERERPGG